MSDLTPLFAPRSVAVLGVSRNPAKLGYRLLENIAAEGYRGPLYPVNPAGEPILGRETLPDIEALPEGVDLALLSLPAPAVADALKRLGQRRVRAAVVLSSGFGEVDERGRAWQRDLVDIARAAGLRLVGPNCMGVYSAPARLNATYFWDLPRLSGRIGIVSQSGAYGGLVFRHLGARSLGVARFLSIGNQADVDVAEVLEFLADDAETGLVACFVEAIRDGRRFVEAARRATSRKPVVVLKGGRSEAGRRAAGSHTGSLAGADEVYRAAFRHANVVLTEETEEFFDAIETLALADGRRPTAPSVAVITVSGGPSVVAADAAERAGLAVPPLGEATREALRALLPPFAAVANPVDLTPHVDRSHIVAAVRRVLDEPAIAGAIALNVGLDVPEFGDAFVDAIAATGKPVVSFVVDAPTLGARLRDGGVPVLASPERAVRAWRALWRSRPRAAPVGDHQPRALPPDLARALRASRGPLPYPVARRLLEAYGIRFCREAIAASPDDAANAADGIGYPVVVKGEVFGLTHKSEAGAVRLDLRHAGEVKAACEDLRARLGARYFIVQERVGPGVELLIGARRDPSFGPVVAVGSGGILAEVTRDVSFRLAPLDRDEARTMWLEGARPRLLAGPRGLPAGDVEPLVEAAVAVGELMLDQPRVLELDLNPVIATGASALAVDALVIVGDEA